MWRRSSLPEPNRKRRVCSAVGTHVFGEELLPRNGAHCLDYFRRAEDIILNQALDELLPLTSFHSKHHNRHSQSKLLTHLHLKIRCRIRNEATSSGTDRRFLMVSL